MLWQCGKFQIDTQVPVIMGILNVTPDSFSDGGQHADVQAAIEFGRTMHDAGAAIIDVGGESTRPGHVAVSPEEELARVLPVVRALADGGICVSIDTRHASVAEACVEAGAAIINDVTGFSDPAMVAVAQGCYAGLIVMHCGNHFGDEAVTTSDVALVAPPQLDIVTEVRDYLVAQAAMLEAAGIAHNRIAIDPGPGFGKDNRQTIEIMRNLHLLVRTGYPVVCAVSRKRYIGEAYGIDAPQDRDEASAEEALMAAELGASIIRAHNVPVHVRRLADVRPYCLVALGCNVALVGGPGEETASKVAQLERAIGDMCLIPDTQLIDVSSFYISEPAYKEDQPEFVNAVALLRTAVPPRSLLQYLHAIEDSLGRVRGEGYVQNGPRTCDLDILDYQLYAADDEELTLPHPRILERDFVVKPLLELLPHHTLSNGTPVTSDAVRYGAATRL